MDNIKCVGIGLQKLVRNIGRCWNECSQDLTFNANLSDLPNVELIQLAKDQFHPHYGIVSATVSATDPTILHVVYTVDSSD